MILFPSLIHYPFYVFKLNLIYSLNFIFSRFKTQLMCFLKTYYPSNDILAQTQPLDAKTLSDLNSSQKANQFQVLPRLEKSIIETNRQGFGQTMSSLFDIVLQNEKVIISLQNKIEEGFKKLEESATSDEETEDVLEENSEVAKIENFHEKLITDSKSGKYTSLKQKIFGQKEYHYKIDLDGQFPVQILKERNFGFNVKLLSSSGAIIKNINPIKLVLGVCDNEGNWITTCGSGMDFMKGNCEIEMLHGEGEFRKLYPREVSRGFRDQQVNFVIYPQPSVLRYVDSMSRWEEYVEPMQVEPLIVEKISIRAKRVVK